MMQTPLTILVATSNAHKLEEIRAVFADLARQAGPESLAGAKVRMPPPQLMGVSDLPRPIAEPVEDQPTFEGNAIKKARHYAAATQALCLADDSGLEVDALNGEPGVRSARYAGVNGPRSVVDPANNKLLLEKLTSVPPAGRTARFVCVMALACPPDPDARPGLSGIPWAQVLMHAHVVAPSGEGRVLALVRGSVAGRILLPEEAADRTQPHRGRGVSGFGYDPLFLIPALDKTAAELPAEQKNAISHRGQAARLMWRELVRLFAV